MKKAGRETAMDWGGGLLVRCSFLRGGLERKRKKKGEGGRVEGQAYDDGDVEDGIRHLGGLGGQERHDELAEGGAEGVREAREGGGGDAAAVREPEVRVARGGAQHEGLRQPDEDLAEHDDAVEAAVARVRAGHAHDVAEDEEDGGRHDGGPRPPVQHVDGQGRDGDEGEEEGRREPVDVRLGAAVVRGGVLGDGREREPLREQTSGVSTRAGLLCYLPTRYWVVPRAWDGVVIVHVVDACKTRSHDEVRRDEI